MKEFPKNLKRIVIVLVVDIDLLQKNISGDITSEGSKALIGYCSICKRKISMTVSDTTIQAQGLDSFFKNFVEIFCRSR